MSVKWHRLGEFIEECDERNLEGSFGVDSLRGVNSQQQFCESRANTVGIDFRPYKVVRKDCFAYNPARLDIGSIARFEGDGCIVSTLYEVFRISEAKKLELLPGYLQVYFVREEFARYVGFKNWGSAREYFWLDAMKRTPIPVPPIEEQRKVVAAWQGLRRMKEQNEQLAEPLLALCRSYLQECKKKYPMREIGPMIESLNERNSNDLVKEIRGMSTEKEFRVPQSRVDINNLTSYKVVRKNDFVFVPTTDTWRCLAICLSSEEYPFVVSPIYEVFRFTGDIIPDYFHLWCKRKEFDRYARYHSWGSARENFSFDDMCRVKIPLLPIEVQQAVVDLYRCANEAKKIAAEADRLSREICPALIQKVARGV